MNTYQSSAQLKALARGQLAGKYPTTIGSSLLIFLCMMVFSILSVFFADTTTIFGMIMNLLITFVIGLFSGIFSAGQAYIYLNISCGRYCKASDVFYGFKNHPDKALLLQLVISAISMGCMLPSYLISLIWSYTGSMILILPACILLIIGTIISVYFSLALSQVFYLLLDFPDYSVKQILSLSMKIMKGHKGRLFYILVSFLPFYLLGVLSCGAAYLWILSYQNATTANFYLDLIKKRTC